MIGSVCASSGYVWGTGVWPSFLRRLGHKGVITMLGFGFVVEKWLAYPRAWATFNEIQRVAVTHEEPMEVHILQPACLPSAVMGVL